VYLIDVNSQTLLWYAHQIIEEIWWRDLGLLYSGWYLGAG